jgi:hypothetical protein
MKMDLLILDTRSNILIEVRFDALILVLTLLLGSFVWVLKFVSRFERRNTD